MFCDHISMIDVASFAQDAGKLLDAIGVVIILVGFAFATAAMLVTIARRKGVHALYKNYRHNLARSILLGLEFLVAGDIVRTVAGDLDLRSVTVLGIIVIIRTLISMEFETEIEGRFPWQRARNK